MTLSQDQFRQQLVDYLYGELQGEELAAFEASLASSEDYRRELAAMRETVQLARQGLAVLEETPPERLRSALVGLGSQLAAAESAAPMRSFWAWLRSPSLLAVAGLATVAVLVVVSRRNPLHPKHDFGVEAAVPVQQEPITPVPSSTPALDPARIEPAVEDRAPAQEKRETKEEEAPRTRREGAARGDARRVPARKQREASSDERPARALEDRAADDLLEALTPSSSEPARAAPRVYVEPPPPRAIEPATPRGAAAESGEADHLKASQQPRDTRFAQPPPAAPAAQSLGAAAPAASSAGAAELAPEGAVRGAREHVRHARWSEASRAYRDLLRRYPGDPRRDDWQRQLDLTNRALSTGHNP